jgi:hypothetical protein
MSRIVECVRDLEVYKAAFEIQQKVFRASKTWPFEKQKVKSTHPRARRLIMEETLNFAPLAYNNLRMSFLRAESRNGLRD